MRKRWLGVALLLLLCLGIMGARADSNVKIGNYTYDIDLGKAEIIKYEGNDRNVVIPSEVEYGGFTNKVVRIAQYVFANHTEIESVVIPASIITLDVYAFENCISLKSVTVQGNIPHCSPAFGNTGSNSGGYTVTFESGVTEIPDALFRYTGKKVDEEYPFVKKVIMADTVTEIGNNAFEGCYSLADVTWSANLETIGAYAFHRDGDLKELNLPQKTKTIKQYAFSECTGLKTLVLPASLKTMEQSVFSDCISLTDVTVKGDITTYTSSFYNTGSNSGGYTVTFAQGVTMIPDRMFHTSAKQVDETYAFVKKAIIPDSVKTIGYYAFERCYDLAELSLGRGLETVKREAFDEAGLVDVFYAGSPKQWDAVSIERGNDPLLNAKMTFGETDPPEAVSVKVKTKISLTIGDTLKLTPTVSPANAAVTFTWGTGDKKVAKVNSKGLVTAVGKGKTTVTVTTDNGLTATCTVTVKAPLPTKVKLNKTGTVTLKAGKKLKLKASFVPAKAEAKLTWKSSKKAVAKVSSDGVVTAVKAGTATITVKTSNGKTAKVKIKVK